MLTVEAEIEKINRQMTAKGYKLTVQREVTLRVLLENEQDHLSAEEVFMLVKSKYPEIGLATVYRTLELLTELHIVVKMNFGDGMARYDLRSEDHEHMHHHLICHTCGALHEIKDDWLLELEERLQREYGFKVTDHRLDFTGHFQSCKGTECKRQRKVV
ncbi:ferric uptake regulator, Fur family [Paenibacillus curdlanolyticus YK9]|uniref:Ferric uptake regulator, Fur family n=1 Tax=Paenibacillus curdlanolyticus YK9 TaxID=717606 RepID=E0IC34_9BACL|nr:Fur family transcriptional regulator [Paenibacillus curdlanolyticus]EFM09720.1 ferric uptake regulator, Fur family [Paenibacillus curdlanolyticus YK9]